MVKLVTNALEGTTMVKVTSCDLGDGFLMYVSTSV
jgi:hypothetical protein